MNASTFGHLRRGILCAALLCLLSLPARAQLGEVHLAREVGAHSMISLHAVWESSARVDEWVVELPVDWSASALQILRYGYDRVPVQVDSSGALLRIVPASPLKSPHVLVVTARTGEPLAHAQIGIEALREFPDGMRGADQYVAATQVRPVERSRENLALRFDGEKRATLDVAPALRPEAPVEIRWKMKTTGHDQLILSSWTGRESDPYLIDAVVGADGRLFLYRGSPGTHAALRSAAPVADGSWHEVVYRYDGRRHRLEIDGETVDSARTAPVPQRLGMLYLGGRSASEHGTYQGWLDDLTVRGGGERQQWTFDEERELPTVPHEPVPVLIEEKEVDLRVHLNRDNIEIRWEAEANPGAEFVLERSTDRARFEPVWRVPSHSDERNGRRGARYRYVDREAPRGVVYYRLRIENGTTEQSPIVKVGNANRERVRTTPVLGNYPNPFRSNTTITYELDERQPVRLELWDLRGHHVRTLVDETQSAGPHEVDFVPARLPSGTYVLSLTLPSGRFSHKVTHLK